MTHGNPNDAELLKELNKNPKTWGELQLTHEQLTDEDRDIKWGGGQKNYEGVIQIPYPLYSPRILKTIGLLSTIGAVTPAYHWTQHGFPSYSPDTPLSPADAIRAATAMIRSERFNEGSLADSIKAGLLDTIVDSLISWYQEESDHNT